MKISLIILGLLALIILYLLYQSNIFIPVKVERDVPLPELKIAYHFRVGSYSSYWKGENAAFEKKLETKYRRNFGRLPCIGIYFDNPEIVPQEKCRAFYGKVLKDEDEFPPIDGVLFDKLPTVKSTLSCSLPLRSVVSIFANMFRIYPAMDAEMEKIDLRYDEAPMIEFYGYPEGMMTVFSFYEKPEGFISDPPLLK